MKNFLEDYRKELHRSACELLLTGMPDVTEELFAEFECTGSRLNYEKIYFFMREMEKVLRIQEREVVIQLMLIANSRKTAEFYRSNDLDAVEGIDSRIIILKAFEKCQKMGDRASNVMIGAMGTNGLEFPYEVITAEILNAFIFAVRKNCPPFHLYYSVRMADLERTGMTTEKIYSYIKNVIHFF